LLPQQGPESNDSFSRSNIHIVPRKTATGVSIADGAALEQENVTNKSLCPSQQQNNAFSGAEKCITYEC